MTRFDDFIAEIEAEARAEGPAAVAELEAFRLHFSLARQLSSQRRAQHLTQKQLAERSGIDQAEISRIERGQANPPPPRSAPSPALSDSMSDLSVLATQPESVLATQPESRRRAEPGRT